MFQFILVVIHPIDSYNIKVMSSVWIFLYLNVLNIFLNLVQERQIIHGLRDTLHYVKNLTPLENVIPQLQYYTFCGLIMVLK